jgi:hypothetical protein
MEDNKFCRYDKELADKANEEAKQQAQLMKDQLDKVKSVANDEEKKED